MTCTHPEIDVFEVDEDRSVDVCLCCHQIVPSDFFSSMESNTVTVFDWELPF